MRAGSSITSLSPRTVSVEGRSACKNSSAGYTSRFIPSGALSTMNASGSNDLTALRIKEDRKFFRFSKSTDILLGSYTRLATFTAEGSFTRSMPKDMRKTLDTVEPVRIKTLVPDSAPTKASASASVRRRWPSPYESCEYIRIFSLLLNLHTPQHTGESTRLHQLASDVPAQVGYLPASCQTDVTASVSQLRVRSAILRSLLCPPFPVEMSLL